MPALASVITASVVSGRISDTAPTKVVLPTPKPPATTIFVDVSAGLRPGSPDNGPLIGEWEDGVLVATGHYRNGILLAPVTGEAIAALLADEEPHTVVRPFAPERFARV